METDFSNLEKKGKGRCNETLRLPIFNLSQTVVYVY